MDLRFLRLQELLVPLITIGVLCSLVLPVAPSLLDLFIVLNLVLAVALLITALHISDALHLSALPTILLLCTLYRLCLNVSTTRLILGSGSGGHVVETFGSFVIGGNLAVGIVVFLILTFIQFVVVAKGSERVAEVAARFTLDAMPGKQMSIDADVRAGLYDMQTARVKRQELQTESRFYGALDGAMKFVKGDAIAGIFIVVVNIIGGIGMGLYRDMSFVDALRTYTILTVGDGLSSQIPSLLNSLAAGLVVTRVGRDNLDSLSSELYHQLSQSKFVMIGAGIFAQFLALVPGMPSFYLISVGAGLFAFSFLKKKRVAENALPISVPNFRPQSIPLLSIKVATAIAPDHSTCGRIAEKVRKAVFQELGILLLPFEVTPLEVKSDELAADLLVLVRGIPSLKGNVKNEDQAVICITDFVRNRRLEFLDDNHTRRLLDTFESEVPELISNCIPHIVTITQLTEMLKVLSKEGVSLRHLDLILQGIAEGGARASSPRELVEEVRSILSRVICGSVANEDGTIFCMTLPPSVDAELALNEKAGGPVSSALIEELLTAVHSRPDEVTCFLVSRGARRILWDLLDAYSVYLPVLSHREVCKDFQFKVVTQVSFSTNWNSGDDEQSLAA